jgi:Domain of unknown function (DUF3846)
MEKKLTVLYVKVGQEPEVLTVEHNITNLQKLVGGYIETVRLPDDVLMVVNEEGLIHDLPLNFVTFVREGASVKPVHEIVGDVFFVSMLGEDFISLDKVQIQNIKRMFMFDRNALIVR